MTRLDRRHRNNFHCSRGQTPMPQTRVPNPIPDPDIGDEGYEMWVRAAEWTPSWLKTLTDPHSHFSKVQATYDQRVNEVFAAKIQSLIDHGHEVTENAKMMARDQAHMAARGQMTTDLVPKEVSKPVWDHLDPMEDPALDDPYPPVGAPQDWEPPPKSMSELMYEQIRDNS